ncbi:MAG: hypothetical protein C0501_17605 [Isosphaera sp.]|nr:hypothetical protein [Isosphaera sp.]
MLSLPQKDQDAIHAELVRARIRRHGGTGPIPVEVDGQTLGYYVPLQAAELPPPPLPQLSDEDRARTQRALADLGNTFDVVSFLTGLRDTRRG